MIQPEKILTVGRFGAPFGVKGWVKVFSYTDPIENILSYSPWQVQLNGQWQALEILDIRKHHQTFIAAIKNCHSPEDAGQYRNAYIGILRSQLPELSEQVYWSDLEGLTVNTVTGQTIGTISSIFATGANDVLVIGTPDNKEYLVPFLRDSVIKNIDLEQGRLTIDWDFE
jgi:16S rRNA processing protein RimM